MRDRKASSLVSGAHGLYPNQSIEPSPMESYNFIFVVQNKMPSVPLGWIHFTGLLELTSD